MSEDKGNIKNEMDDDFSSSTVFAAPVEHNDKKKAGKFSLLKKIIAAVLCVAILVGSTVLVVKLIPERQENSVGIFEPKQVMALSVNTFKKITVTHSEATLVLTSSLKETDGESKQVWTLEGYDSSLINSISLSQIATYASSITAYGEYDYDQTQAAKYGFDNPVVVVEVDSSEADRDFTLTQGNSTADGKYCYLLFSAVPNKVFLVDSSIMSGFIVEPLDLAISTAIPPIQKTNSNKKYFDSEDLLCDFDTLTISGAKFKTPLVFIPNKDQRFSSYATYICTSPKARIADGVVEDVRNIFRDGVSASGVVSFDQSAQSIKKFGLNSPDIVVTIKVAGVDYWYKLKATDSSFTEFYVAASTDIMIRTVTITNVSFAGYEEKDFYLGFMALESIADVSEFTLKGEVNTSFTVKKDEESEEAQYIVMNNGKAVTSEDFQDFYAVFMGTMAIDYNTVSVSGSPDLTITMKHHNGSPATVLTYYKISESRYQYSVGGVPMGQISSSAYSKIVREITNLIP